MGEWLPTTIGTAVGTGQMRALDRVFVTGSAW